MSNVEGENKMDISFIEYIKPELLILVPVLYLIGIGLKQIALIKDKWIPLILGIFSITLSVIYVVATADLYGYKDILMGIFVAITQGVLCAGSSVYINQLIKQGKKTE